MSKHPQQAIRNYAIYQNAPSGGRDGSFCCASSSCVQERRTLCQHYTNCRRDPARTESEHRKLGACSPAVSQDSPSHGGCLAALIVSSFTVQTCFIMGDLPRHQSDFLRCNYFGSCVVYFWASWMFTVPPLYPWRAFAFHFLVGRLFLSVVRSVCSLLGVWCHSFYDLEFGMTNREASILCTLC